MIISSAIRRWTMFVQGLYYILTSLWPLINTPSFESLLGFKPDKFQFYTTTLLLLVVGIVLIVCSRTRDKGAFLLALGVPVALLIAEVGFYSSLQPLFLVDFVLEVGFLGTLLFSKIWKAGYHYE